jgi:two-component system response regulator PilR (NtrC family)
MARERGAPFKILIVDDEEAVRDAFRGFCDLTDSFSVDLVDSGLEAIERVCKDNYDLVTIDLIMPDISGLEALRQIKDNLPKVPVMIITGNATDKTINDAGMLGACRIMHKPVSLKEFAAELTSALARGESKSE